MNTLTVPATGAQQLGAALHQESATPSVMDQIAAAEKARKDRISHLLGEREAKTSVHELALKNINDELKALGHKRPRQSPMRTPKNATAGGAK